MFGAFRRHSNLDETLKKHQVKLAIAEIKQSTPALLNRADSSGFTPLQRSTMSGLTEVVLWLLAAKSDVNVAAAIKDPTEALSLSQQTPLTLAIKNGHWVTAQVLLACGADKNKAIYAGQLNNDDEIVNALEDLTLDPDIFRAVFYWGITHFHQPHGDHLFKLLVEKIDTENAVILIEKQKSSPHQDEHAISIEIPAKNAINEDEKKQESSLHQDENDTSIELQRYLFKHHYAAVICEESHLDDPLKQTVEINRSSPRNDDPPQMQSSLNVEQDFYGWLELAAERQIPQEVLFSLYESNHLRSRTDGRTASLWYWVVKYKLFSDMEQLNNHYGLALQQLQEMGEDAILEERINALTAEQKKSFMQENACPIEVISELTPEQKKIYTAAKFAKLNLLKLFDTTNQEDHRKDYFAVLSYALIKKDLVALDTLLSYLDSDEVLTYALENNQRALLFILLFSQDRFQYEHLNLSASQNDALFALIGNNSENVGVLNRIIKSGCGIGCVDIRTPTDVKAQIDYFTKRQVTLGLFLSIYSKQVQHWNDINSMADIVKLSHDKALLLREHAKRFGLDLSVNNISSKPKKNMTRLEELRNNFFQDRGPAMTMLSFLELPDKEKLSRVSKSCYKLSISMELQMADQLLALLTLEIQRKPFWSHRNFNITRREIAYALIFIGSITAFPILLPLSILSAIKGDSLFQQINSLPIHKDPGYIYTRDYYVIQDCDDPNLSDNTLTALCNAYEKANDEFIGEIISTGISFIPLLLFFMHYIYNGFAPLGFFPKLWQGLRPGKERFDNILLSTLFSPLFQNEAARFFNAARTRDPEFSLTLNSTVAEFVSYIENAKKNVESVSEQPKP